MPIDNPVQYDPPPPTRRRVAVVGAGVSGLTAAWLLQHRHEVTLYEREARLGGHTHTVVIPDGPDAGTPVDTGFIVMNERNYPLLTRLLARLGIATQPSDMSFSFHDEATGFHYAGTGFAGLAGGGRNLVSPAFGRLLVDILRFHRRARRDLARGLDPAQSIGDYVDRLRVSRAFAERYLEPMGAAIWSASRAALREFPAEAFLRFFDNHGLLSLTGAPRWRTIAGGSHAYVAAMMRGFRGTVRRGAPVTRVRRAPDGPEVATADGRLERHDAIVIATHADEALALLADPSPDERRLLGAWRYSVNHTVLHTDPVVLPPTRAAWASWNYVRERGAGDRRPVSVTYFMDRLQRLRTRERYCVTLNRARPVAAGRVVREMTYTHPVFDAPALASQAELPRLNGTRATWYCGAHFGWGFHEDGVRSGAAAAAALGTPL
jgi:predicted NAD/FAD-binding protein